MESPSPVSVSSPSDDGHETPDACSEEEQASGVRFSVKKILFAFSPLAALGGLIALGIPICPSKGLLGLPCPGCGLTRGTEAMLQGDLAAMVAYHPLTPILAPLFGWSILRVTLISAGLLSPRHKDPISLVPQFVWPIFAVFFFGLWILRLSGYLGGHPDSLDFTQGYIYRVFEAAYQVVGG